MKIEKGKRYLRTGNGYRFTKGKSYQSPKDGYLIDDNGNEFDVTTIEFLFQLVEEPSTEELLKRIEALEKRVKQYESKAIINEAFDNVKQSTAAMFKDIADHANAINDIVKNAPDETIYVPDGILDVNMEIINVNKTLWHDEDGWNVLSYGYPTPSTHQQFKLVKCEREELKAGDVAFRSDYDDFSIDKLGNYCIVLEDGSVQYWNRKDCANESMNWNHWYKVVEA